MIRSFPRFSGVLALALVLGGQLAHASTPENLEKTLLSKKEMLGTLFSLSNDTGKDIVEKATGDRPEPSTNTAEDYAESVYGALVVAENSAALNAFVTGWETFTRVMSEPSPAGGPDRAEWVARDAFKEFLAMDVKAIRKNPQAKRIFPKKPINFF